MNRIVHYELMAERPETIKDFYEKAFGWKFSKWEGGNMDYWMIESGSGKEQGINGGMAMKQKGFPGVANTLDVPDVDKAIDAIKKAGGSIVAPKMAIPGMGYLAYFKDPEGNVSGIMKRDLAAK